MQLGNAAEFFRVLPDRLGRGSILRAPAILQFARRGGRLHAVNSTNLRSENAVKPALVCAYNRAPARQRRGVRVSVHAILQSARAARGSGCGDCKRNYAGDVCSCSITCTK
jgi:hypothetical protein